jgi:hypothetical protein
LQIQGGGLVIRGPSQSYQRIANFLQISGGGF